ncbi:MAG: hypothetical protein H7249_00100 [Chitinophagaceae bacterium]|nr:hypothetical protein [Oligoflexus sp.]
MKNLVAAVLLSLAVSTTATSFAAEAAAPGAITCLLGMADNVDAQLILTSTDDTFSIKQPSSDHHAIETVYEKSPIDLLMAPIEAPFLECKQEHVEIKVWDKVVLVNGQYYRIDNATVTNEN